MKLNLIAFIALTASLATAEPLLSEATFKEFESAPIIEARLLDPMPFTPVFRAEAVYYGIRVPLNAEQRKVLLGALNAAELTEPEKRFNECKYLPGVAFTVPESKLPGVLLCFNCDLWALESKGSQPETPDAETLKLEPVKIGAYGDSRTQRAALWQLFGEIKAAVKMKSAAPGAMR